MSTATTGVDLSAKAQGAQEQLDDPSCVCRRLECADEQVRAFCMVEVLYTSCWSEAQPR